MDFYENEIIKHCIKETEKLEKQVLKAQARLVEAYKRTWSEINYLVEQGVFPGIAVSYPYDAFGCWLEEQEMCIIQVEGLLPFIPSYSGKVIEDSYKDYLDCKAFFSARIRDVAEKMKQHSYNEPVALFIKYYLSPFTKQFDFDNRSKSFLINSIKGFIIKDDSWNHVAMCQEEAKIHKDADRTMIYIVPYRQALSSKTLDTIYKIKDLTATEFQIIRSSIPGKTIRNLYYSPPEEDTKSPKNTPESNTKTSNITNFI